MCLILATGPNQQVSTYCIAGKFGSLAVPFHNCQMSLQGSCTFHAIVALVNIFRVPLNFTYQVCTCFLRKGTMHYIYSCMQLSFLAKLVQVYL